MGRVAVVTGGARGIGWATAAALRNAGAHVAIGDLDPARTALAAEELGLHGAFLDVTDTSSVETFLDDVESRLGPVAIWINNAGIMPIGPVLEQPDAVIRRAVDVNVLGVMNGSRAAARRMTRRGEGRIVNVASIAGRIPAPGMAVYNGTKFAVVGFGEALDAELRHRGVRVSTVLPSFTNNRTRVGHGARPDDPAHTPGGGGAGRRHRGPPRQTPGRRTPPPVDGKCVVAAVPATRRDDTAPDARGSTRYSSTSAPAGPTTTPDRPGRIPVRADRLTPGSRSPWRGDRLPGIGSAADRGEDLVERGVDGHLTGFPVKRSRSSTLPSAKPRPTTTTSGTPINSESLNFTPATPCDRRTGRRREPCPARQPGPLGALSGASSLLAITRCTSNGLTSDGQRSPLSS